MTNETIADRLALYALCLEVAGADAFRVRSYQNAARRLASSDADVAALTRAGRVTEIEGIGAGIAERIATLVSTGTLPEIDALRARIPDGVVALMRLPVLGARRALTIYAELGIDSPEALAEAARDGRLERIAGIGERTAARIRAALERERRDGGRVRLDVADRAAARLTAAIPLREGERLTPTGPQRRRCETIDRLVFVACSRRRRSLLDAFTGAPGVVETLAHGERDARVRLDVGIEARLTITGRSAHASTLLHTTGSTAHLAALEARAAAIGGRRHVARRDVPPLAGRSEAAIYAALGLPFVAPELREADHVPDLDGAVPPAHALVRRADLRGLVHVHSTWSDGRATIAESARAAEELGMEYLVICDHSAAAHYAGGMTPARARLQRGEIDALDTRGGPVRVLAGIEVDILPDGRLDYHDALLATFDVVIASIHGGVSADEAATFARLERALAHPAIHVLGHPTGRRLLERDPYVRDTERLVDLCVESGVALEINALPQRLDLDWRAVRYGRTRGARFVVSSDAHSLEDLARIDYGVSVARKGGLGARDVLNTRDADAFLAALAEPKGR